MDNLNPEFKKNLSRDFWKNAIWSFLLYEAKSDLRVKSVNRVPFKATGYQIAFNMWYSIPDQGKKCHCFFKISLFCIRKGEKPIFTIKHWFYSQNRIFALPDAKEENFIKQKAFFFLNSLWNITFYCHFDNKMPQKVLCLLIFPSSQTQLYIVKNFKSHFFKNLSKDFS